MNSQVVRFDRYPLAIAILENSVWFSIYALGSVLFLQLETWTAGAFAAYCVLSMYLVIPKLICTHCSYFGSICHSGQGRIASLLFTKSDQTTFSAHFRSMTLAAPVFLAPLIAGLALTLIRFSWQILGTTLVFGVLALWCSRMVTLRLGCPHCKQQPICPAYLKSKGRSK